MLALLLVWSCRSENDRGASGRLQPESVPFDLSAARTIIEQKNAQFTAANVAGDVATIDAMFTRDARSFPPGADAANGHASL